MIFFAVNSGVQKTIWIVRGRVVIYVFKEMRGVV